MSAFFSSLFFTIFLSINLFSNDSFYTISICSNLSYKDALYCKNNILREELYDIIITKEKNTQYRTNYGIFSSIKEARENKRKELEEKQDELMMKQYELNKLLLAKKDLYDEYLTR